MTCIAVALAVPPAAVRSQLAVPSSPQPAAPAATNAPLADVVPMRDPFVPRVETEPEPAPRLTPAPLPPPAGPTVFHPLPAPTHAVRVTAVATGPHPTALVEEDGRPRLVEPDDELDGSSVRLIDDEGIVLDDGRRLTVPPPVSP